MSNPQIVNLEDLSRRRLKLSEFVLGIFLGIIISVIIESIFKLFQNANSLFFYLMTCISFLMIPFIYIWYKRIVSYPDIIEYSCNFKKKENIKWKELILNLKNSINTNLSESNFNFFRAYNWKWEEPLAKYKHNWDLTIRRTKLGSPRVRIKVYEKKDVTDILLYTWDLSDKATEMIKILGLSLADLERLNFIDSGWKCTPPSYYHLPLFIPFRRKGKKIIFKKD